MKTEDLVGMLARGVEPVDRAAHARRTAVALAIAASISILMTATLLGLRRATLDQPALPMLWVREGFCVSLTLAGFLWFRRLGRPGAGNGAAPIAILATLAGLWALAGWVLAISPPGERAALVLGQTALVCPFLIAMLSAPLFVAYALLMRSMAPTRLRLAGAVTGFAAGAGAALVYTLHCPELAAPFLGTWYVLGMMIPTVAGLAFGPRLLRW